MPATPVTDSSRGRASRPVVCSSSLTRRSSSSRPTNGGSGAEPRPEPPSSLTIRSARQAGTLSCLPFRVSASIGAKAIASQAAR